MTQTRIMFGLLIALILGAVVGWLVLQPEDEATGLHTVGFSTSDNAEDSACAIEVPNQKSTGALANSSVSEPTYVKRPSDQTRPIEVGESTGSSQQESRTPDSQQPAGADKTKVAAQPEQKVAAPAPPKKLTPQQREEARRVKTGRPALKKRLTRTPVSSITGKMTKTHKQQEWEDSFVEQGLESPEMIPTKVTGKIMSEQSRAGLAKATVGLMTFFPLDGLAGGPLYPVLTTLTTDDKGNFTGEIPGSKLVPSNYAALAITVTWEGHTVLAGQPAALFEAGQDNSLGIIWAPDQPYQVRCDASAFSGEMAVVATGNLDPQRWHPKKRVEAFSWFPQFKPLVIVADAGPIPEGLPQEGQCDVVGTWGIVTPYVSLTREGILTHTRRPKPSMAMSNVVGQQIPQPFEKLVFSDENKQPISGQIVDANGAGIANAEVSALGDTVTQTVITDAAGWFNFEVAPEKTSYLRVVHSDWVETQQQGITAGDTAVLITLTILRPRFTLRVADLQTQSPIVKVSLRVTGIIPFGKDKGKAGAEEFIELESQSGEYAFEWKHEVKSLVIEKIGYFPYTINQPAQKAEQSQDVIAIELNQGRELTFRPRDFTNAERNDRWFPDSKASDPGIYTAWSNHWLEYEVDFGEEPEPEQEGGFFDIILGCTNTGIVDNDYRFEVEILVDNKVVGKLSIMADSTTIRTGRISLGKLSGTHNIRLRWLNDKWIPGQLDANIRYASLVFVEQPG
ncbi:MAG: carboxypeptidase regulatory-like domain-containing protein [Planctomycetes bacterium]|nr:carboxypeptidase regulatory-like domain-containing protein [Planctomycetota bacterium]